MKLQEELTLKCSQHRFNEIRSLCTVCVNPPIPFHCVIYTYDVRELTLNVFLMEDGTHKFCISPVTERQAYIHVWLLIVI